MGVDSGYGSGPVRSASNSASRANATRAAANRKKGAARNAKARTIANRAAAAAPSKVRDKYNPTIAANIGNAISYAFDGPNGGMINGQRTLQSGTSPWNAIAMYTSRIARYIEEGANIATLTNVARRAPRSPVAHRAAHGVARAALDESGTLVKDVVAKNPMGYTSTMFPDHVMHLFRPEEVQSIYRAAAKFAGREASNNLSYWNRMAKPSVLEYSQFERFREAGKNLRYVSRKGFK